MKDRRWAAPRNSSGARLLEYVVLTLAIAGFAFFVSEAVGGMLVGPFAATAATLEQLTTTGHVMPLPQ